MDGQMFGPFKRIKRPKYRSHTFCEVDMAKLRCVTIYQKEQRSGHLNFAAVFGEIGPMAPKSWNGKK